MADPGWYPDTTRPGTQRYWDGVAWTGHTAPLPTAAPVVPPPVARPRLRADGTVKGPSLWSSLAVAGSGVVLVVAALVLIVPAFIEAVSGPRWDVPGTHRTHLEEGAWLLHERVDFAGFVDIRPEHVIVDGPAPVSTRFDASFTETITINEREYVGVVRFDITEAGTYDITVRGEPSAAGEVLLARPLSTVGSYWPWFVAIVAGGLLMVAGIVMAILGSTNRSRAKRAGITV